MEQINKESVSYIMSKNQIFSRTLQLLDLAIPAFWTLCFITYLVIQFAFDLKQNFAIKIAFIVLTLLLGWRFFYLWLKVRKSVEKKTSEKDDAIFVSGLWSALAFILILAFSALVVQGLVNRSKIQFNNQRTEIFKNSDEFPFIRDFSKQHFGLDVVLGGIDDAWLITSLTLDVPGASPASMAYSTGHCILNMNKMRTLESFSPKNFQDADAFMKGVLIHEFGHCLDVTRDAPNYGASTYQVNSVDPKDALKVKDAQTFVEASSSDRTTLWREVFSDVLISGYWRLSNPNRAQDLTDEWSQLRLNNTKDKVHQTSCWLTELKKVEDPKDFASLRDWADRQRTAFYVKCTPTS